MPHPIRYSPRTLTFHFVWTGHTSDGVATEREGWRAFHAAAHDGSIAAVSTVTERGAARLQHALVVDTSSRGEADLPAVEALRAELAALPHALTAFLDGEEPGAWRCVLPLSGPVDLADPVGGPSFARAVLRAAGELAASVGLSHDAARRFFSASLEARPIPVTRPKVATSGMPVNVEGMVLYRGPDDEVAHRGGLAMGEVVWHLNHEEAKGLATELWAFGAPQPEIWPHGAAPPTEPAHPRVRAERVGDHHAAIHIGPVSFLVHLDEARPLAADIWPRAT